MYKILVILFWSFSAFAELSDIEDLGKREELFNQTTASHIKVLQNRWVDKQHLSELSLSLSPSLRSFYYMSSYSTSLSYRFFVSEEISFFIKYDSFFNSINQDGKDEIFLYGRIPLELKYPIQKSYLLGWEWYPFYAKAMFFNQVLHFDFYFSMGIGKIELLGMKKKPDLIYSSLGMVHWWSKRVNTRMQIESFYYRYRIPESVKKWNRELNYKSSFSVGVLF